MAVHRDNFDRYLLQYVQSCDNCKILTTQRKERIVQHLSVRTTYPVPAKQRAENHNYCVLQCANNAIHLVRRDPTDDEAFQETGVFPPARRTVQQDWASKICYINMWPKLSVKS